MRLFWSLVLTGGLLLVGLDVYQAQQSSLGSEQAAPTRMEDGTGFPPPDPPR
jgi:hypothetical protein